MPDYGNVAWAAGSAPPVGSPDPVQDSESLIVMTSSDQGGQTRRNAGPATFECDAHVSVVFPGAPYHEGVIKRYCSSSRLSR